MAAREGRSRLLATILSLVIPGLGHFYLGQIGKGIMFIIIGLTGGGLVATVVGAIVGIPMLIVNPIWAAIDAYRAAAPPGSEAGAPGAARPLGGVPVDQEDDAVPERSEAGTGLSTPTGAGTSAGGPPRGRTVMWAVGGVLALSVLIILTVGAAKFAHQPKQSPRLSAPAEGRESSQHQPVQASPVTLDCASGEALSPFGDRVTDFDISYRVAVTRREGCLLFRLGSERRNGYGDSYGVTFCPFANQGANPGLYLVKRIAGSESVLAYTQAGFPRSSGTTRLRVSATGPSLRVYENGALALQAEDASLPSGRLAWRVFGDSANPAWAEFTVESLAP